MEQITSIQNPKIKHLLALQQKSSLRREEGLFVVEGQRELMHCINAGYEVDSIFSLTSNLSPLAPALLARKARTSNLYEVSPKVYEKIAYRGSTEGIIGIVKAKEHSLSTFNFPLGSAALHSKEHSTFPLIIVLESVEKPGNLGAILRSADAAGVDGVIVCDPLTDLYNPNLIRSSIGAIFTVPVATCSSEECIAFLKDNGIQILTAQLQDSNLYYDQDMTKGTAIVMGTEATGLTDQWREAADAHIRIPMLGALDSLNVSVSAAILMYEAVRQRKTILSELYR
ncbi:MAG: RNA methyltransferase [Prevotella sp.]|nr:RNA methyltransferase [Prevotella sp.]